MSYTDRIHPTDKGISTYIEELLKKNYQIPTFQRNVVWEKDNVKKLWDSIYKFYPLGSLLIWKTGIKLHNHKEIGGHVISDPDFSRPEYQYILDGQQRTTALLTALQGGKIAGKGDFNPTLYIDLTIENAEDPDDDLYKKRFLFWDDIDDKSGQIKPNIGKMTRFKDGLIVKLFDVKHNYADVERALHNKGYSDFDHPYRANLRKIKEVFDNYRLSFIELKGIQVAEVCQIFERINREGEPLGIFDIVVAKTYRPQTDSNHGFYLRELIDNFKKQRDSKYLEIEDLTYLQILAVIINQNIPGSGIQNITDRYLTNIKPEQIENTWHDSQKAILKTFDFLENHLHLKGPQLIPYRYFYLTLASYFFRNPKPNYSFLKQYFWYYSFHNEDLLENTTHLFEHVKILNQEKSGVQINLGRFLIDKNKLRASSYTAKGRLSRALLSFYAYQEPKDWKNTDRNVLSDVYYVLTDKPNLHHVFPVNYVNKNPGKNKVNANSLMNIVYLTQITNIEISDQNPLEYIKQFDNKAFESIMKAHFLPHELLDWSRSDTMPENALDHFIEQRMEHILQGIKNNLPDLNVEVFDSSTPL